MSVLRVARLTFGLTSSFMLNLLSDTGQGLGLVQAPLCQKERSSATTEERWHYLRSHDWSNVLYGSYDALRQTACDAWQKHCLDPN